MTYNSEKSTQTVKKLFLVLENLEDMAGMRFSNQFVLARANGSMLEIVNHKEVPFIVQYLLDREIPFAIVNTEDKK